MCVGVRACVYACVCFVFWKGGVYLMLLGNYSEQTGDAIMVVGYNKAF